MDQLFYNFFWYSKYLLVTLEHTWPVGLCDVKSSHEKWMNIILELRSCNEIYRKVRRTLLELFPGIIKQTTIRVHYTMETMSKLNVTSINFQKSEFSNNNKLPFYLTVWTWHNHQITVHGYQTGLPVDSGICLTCNV